MHDEVKQFKIRTTVGDITVKSDQTLGPREFRFESPTVATACARCSHAFTSRPDGFVDEALEAEIAAHQERCFVAGENVRWDHPTMPGNWIEGQLIVTRPSSAGIGPSAEIRVETSGDRVVRRIGSVADVGLDGAPLRRIPRLQQGDAVQSAEAPTLSPETIKRLKYLAAPIPKGNPTGVSATYGRAPLLYDGLTARECWHRWADNAHWIEQRGPQALHAMTPGQIAAAKVENVDAMKAWPERLRAKIAASTEAERCRVRVQLDDLDGEPW